MNTKHTPFQMHPASTPRTARGTPQASGEAGGCIWKDAGESWIHVHAAALLAVAHIALTERDQGQHDDANSHRTENTNSDVGFEHGGSSDGLSLQDISPEELWDALVTAIEEGEAHGLSHLRRLCRDQISRHRLALPNECSNDAINDAIRKVFGPLVHGLVADADCRGGRGGGASQQFNGF